MCPLTRVSHSRSSLKQIHPYFQELRSKIRRPSHPKILDSKANLLILGSPRSGTSLLAAMLASHTQISVLFEEFWGGAGSILAKRYKGVKLCIPNQIELRYHWTIIDYVLARIPKLRSMTPLFKSALSKYSIEDYVLNNELKIVSIVRDKESVVSSMLNRTKYTPKLAKSEWSRSIEIMHTLYEKYPDRMILVKFNSLVESPEQTAKALSDFLDIDFEMDMLQAYKHTPNYKTKGIEASKAKSNGTEANMGSKLKKQYEILFENAI